MAIAVNIYSSLTGDGFESEEIKLYNLVNEYRAQNGLPPIAASKALTTVANRHVQDVAENLQIIDINDPRNPHSWSDAPYDPNNPNTYPSVWTAPQRLNTGYSGYGYENFFRTTAPSVTAEQALEGWKNSPAHNAAILNQGIWQNSNWNALGVGIYKGYAALWFGEEVDPTGTPSSGGISIAGTDNSETLTGGDGNDTIIALGGEDLIFGYSGEDVLFGNQGNDTLYGNQGNDTIQGGKGGDIIQGGRENDLLFGNLDNDTIYGNLGNDTVFGGRDNDIICGGKDDDLLCGDLGNDSLYGDFGADILTGGDGNDVFALQAGRGTDTITDFNDGIDLIGLTDGLSFGSLSISQSNGNTLISTNGEILAILTGIQVSTISDVDFRAI